MILAAIGLFVPASAALGLAIAVVIGSQVRGARFALVAVGTAVVLLPQSFWRQLGLVVLVIIVPPVVVAVARFAVAPLAVKRHYPAAIWARVRWRWLARNLGLAKRDVHVQDKRRRSAVLPGVRYLPPATTSDPGRHKVRHLRARFRPTADGITARLRTIPGTGRAEIEAAADHIANEWRCARVQVVQEAPRRVVLHGLRTDPLTVPYSATQAPPGTFTAADLTRLYLGRDAFARHRWLPLPGVTGITVSGLPGTGKTSLVNSWLCQTAGSAAVQYAVADGKGGSDFHDWRPRCWLYAEDELDQGVALLEDVHAEMRRRLGSVLELTGGKRNAWHVGPTEAMPLLMAVLDEVGTYTDVASFKGDPKREAIARRCSALTSQIIRKGRSVLMLVILVTQKPTVSVFGDGQARDNAALSVSFGLKTTEAAVCALGEGIREFPGYSPVLLRDPSMTGVCSATLPTGTDPFALLRVPEITEAMASERAAATAHLRRDPAAALTDAAADGLLVPPELVMTPDGVTR